jgi:hypothetical protein
MKVVPFYVISCSVRFFVPASKPLKGGFFVPKTERKTMALNLIRPTAFTEVLSIVNDTETVFVIPSFQRPYAWGGRQIDDLFRDMEKANQTNGYHYLSALHLISLQPQEAYAPLSGFIDSDIEHLSILQESELKTNLGKPVHVYAVVDGQQRLTTLFLLAHIYYANQGSSSLRSALAVTLKNGKEVPRIVQNPIEDHDFMMNLVAGIWAPTGWVAPRPLSQSQKHMRENFLAMKRWAKEHSQALEFLGNVNFKTSAIELDPGYGLTSFMTLNDRGKPLTVLEKLKALLLQFSYDVRQVNSNVSNRLINRLHEVFGKIYKVLSACQPTLFTEKGGDDEMVRLLSCYLRLDTQKEAIWQGAEAAYEEYFRDRLLQASLINVPTIVDGWCDGIEQVYIQLVHLNDYLSGKLGKNIQSLHFSRPSSVSDDYQIVLFSLRLQPHLLALLLKFRVLFPEKEWHDRFPIQTSAFPLKQIHVFLQDVSQRVGTAPQALQDYIDTLLKQDVRPRTEISMLEAVERMQVLDWNLGSRRLQGFVDWCRATFAYASPSDFVAKWAVWRSAGDFIDAVLKGKNEANFRFLLKEYERRWGSNLHFIDPVQQRHITDTHIELEHVFAQNIDGNADFIGQGGFLAFGIADRTDFDENVLWRSGNLTWLSEKANISLGNQTPDIKAADYRACPGHPGGSSNNQCSNIAITKKLGDELFALGANYAAMRFYVEARCAELALFAVSRFS